MPKIVIESDPGDIQLRFLLTVNEKLNDPILEYFRVPDYREQVIGFFSDICPNVEIVRAILNNADKFDVPPALAFALSWEESRFNPNAVNVFNRDGSIDRGLFQLNNRSFPNIELNVFFDIDSNAYYGIAHLRHCLDSGGSVVSALAMYNAGAGRVRSSGTPEVTLDYISRILENQRKIEGRFNVRLVKEDEPQIVEAILIEEPVEIHPFYFTGGTLLGLKPKHIYSSW
uniref:Transglycosylase SLT domain-containing protein n=1 Tax=uncultured bacterium contig00031 TaxID=1181520 RepID=A0A806KQB1_9BACT|nr:hypothetical protein [uncultured bacterium contig00031]